MLAAVRPVRELPCEAVRLVVQLGSMLPSWADKLNPQFVQGGPCGEKRHVHAGQGFGVGAFKNKGGIQIRVLGPGGVIVMLGVGCVPIVVRVFWFFGRRLLGGMALMIGLCWLLRCIGGKQIGRQSLRFQGYFLQAALGGSGKDENIFCPVQCGRHALYGLDLFGGRGRVLKGQRVGKRAFEVNAHNRAFNGHIEAGRAVFVRAMGRGRAGGKQGGANRQKDHALHYISRSNLQLLTRFTQNVK